MYHKHHRKRRSQGGADEPANILKVTPEVHEWIHQNPSEAFQLGWLVHEYEEPEEVVVALPENLTMKPKAKRTHSAVKPRTRATISFKVPKDSREDGAGLFDDYWAQVTEALEEDGITTGGQTGQYAALIALCVFYLNTR